MEGISKLAGREWEACPSSLPAPGSNILARQHQVVCTDAGVLCWHLQVAHYLVLTHLSSSVHAMPMEEVSRMAADAVANRKRPLPQPATENPVFKAARTNHER